MLSGSKLFETDGIPDFSKVNFIKKSAEDKKKLSYFSNT